MNSSELIVGARAIAEAIGLTPKRVYDMHEARELPTVKIGKSVAIRRTRLAEFINGLEASAGVA